METRFIHSSWPAAVLMIAAAAPAQAQDGGVRVNDGETTLTIRGLVSTSFLINRSVFGGFGQGQNAEWAARTPLSTDEIFTDGDVRSTRLRLDVAGAPAFGAWRPAAALEGDFFGGEGAPPFGDEQPRPRVRFAYVDLSNGRTTVRVGQMQAPLFGQAPVSVTHIAFPVGYGATGMIGWRGPGVFVYHDLARGGPVQVQLQFAALRGSGAVPAGSPDSTIEDGDAAGVPQIQGRLNLGGKTGAVTWTGYVVGHVDRKDMSGAGATMPNDELTGWAIEGGGSVTRKPITLLGNYYTGRAVGQHLAHITQIGDIRGWGAWAQLGYDLTSRWSAWAFYGIDDPDERRFARTTGQVLPRQRNQSMSGLLRFRAGRYAVGLEYFRAVTDWSGDGRSDADQVALSALYTL